MTTSSDAVLAQHPEARHVLALAKDWAAVATGKAEVGASETLQFTAVWIAFNALYNLASSAGRDYDRVGRFADRNDVASVHRRLLETDPSYSEAVVTLAARPVYNHWRQEEARISDHVNVREVLDVCYAIRGNLVHGYKSPKVDRDLHLVGAAYRVILPLVNHFADPIHFFHERSS